MFRHWHCAPVGVVAALWACTAVAAVSDRKDPPSNPWAGDGSVARLAPPTADDRTFVLDTGAGLDTPCTFRSGGPLIIRVPINRYLGPTNPDGTLRDAADLVREGLISPFATVTLPAFDVDFTGGGGGVQPERDRVSFNGVNVKTLNPRNSEWLQGDNQVWRLNSFQIPIDKVKFPSARGALGALPANAFNEIRIDIDVLNPTEEWCTAIDWVAITFKCMSPIALVHGNGSNGGFWARQGFTAGLNAQFLQWDNSITNASATIAVNAGLLNTQIPNIAKSFGADSIHLVCHSKGGLDSRGFLTTGYPAQRRTLKVVSLNTVGTPHNGSVLADVGIARQTAAAGATFTDWVGFPRFTGTVAWIAGVDAGMPNLTTTFVGAFNPGNVAALPRDCIYNTLAADADRNGSGDIDNPPPDEFAGLRSESAELTRIFGGGALGRRTAAGIVDLMYQVLRNTAGVTVVFTPRTILGRTIYTTATITSIPTAAPLPNDTLVTIPSGLGNGSIRPLVTNRATLVGAAGRDHADIADAVSAGTVGPWIVAAERANGDLK